MPLRFDSPCSRCKGPRETKGHAYCRACARERRRENPPEWKPKYRLTQRKRDLLKKYGLEWAEYLRIRSEQNACCAICHRPEDDNRHEQLYVDHCHSTGQTRSLLCQKCNFMIGQADDDPSILQKAIDYLKHHGHR